LCICELVRTQVSDITVEGAWAGLTRLQLFDHALVPLADLPVLEFVAASHILADLTPAQQGSSKTTSRTPMRIGPSVDRRNAAAPDMADDLHWTRWRRRYHGMTSDRRTHVLNRGALSTSRPITRSAAPPMLTP
jgi:hypothetical protein